MAMKTNVATSKPVDRRVLGSVAAGERTSDLADCQENAVEAHHGATVVGVGLGHVGQQAQCRRRGAGEHEEPRTSK